MGRRLASARRAAAKPRSTAKCRLLAADTPTAQQPPLSRRLKKNFNWKVDAARGPLTSAARVADSFPAMQLADSSPPTQLADSPALHFVQPRLLTQNHPYF